MDPHNPQKKQPDEILTPVEDPTPPLAGPGMPIPVPPGAEPVEPVPEIGLEDPRHLSPGPAEKWPADPVVPVEKKDKTPPYQIP